MRVTVFGAAGPTGVWICRQALTAGHEVTAVSRRSDPLPLPANDQLTIVRADAQTGDGVVAAVTKADAVLSALGSPYRRKPITIYSAGTRNIVEAMRTAARGKRLVVVSSGLTFPPPPINWATDHLLVPILRGVVGRTLYADMRAMEDQLGDVGDLAWTVMRPARLMNADEVSSYRLDLDHPSQGYTSRPDLAAAMVAELSDGRYLHKAVAPTTTRRGRGR